MLRKILTTFIVLPFLFISENLHGQYVLCSSYEKVWFDAEYLYWQINRSSPLIPLVVQGPVVSDGSPVLGQPGTRVVLGGEEVPNRWRSGARFSFGYMIDDAECAQGFELNYFCLPKNTYKKWVHSKGLENSPFLSIPFYDVTTDSESSTPLANPGIFAGKAVVRVRNYMQGAEINLFRMTPLTSNVNIGGLIGARYWNFEEGFSFDTSSPYLISPVCSKDVFQTQDHFEVANHFAGGQIGLNWEYILKQLLVAVKLKLSIGAMFQTADIDGTFVTNEFSNYSTTQAIPGGYFALPSNSGHHNHISLSVIPEADIKVGYQVTEQFRLNAGYTFLWASHVLFVSDQIRRNINPTQSSAIQGVPCPTLVGEAVPTYHPRTKNLWVQGFSVGFDYIF